VTALLLPLRTDGALAYTFTVSLGVATPADFRFRFHFNQVDSCWYMDVYNSEGDLECGGVKCVLGTFLAERGLWAGHLFLDDQSGQDLEPTETDFGTRVLMYYVE
jgi:hypothetical protein